MQELCDSELHIREDAHRARFFAPNLRSHYSHHHPTYGMASRLAQVHCRGPRTTRPFATADRDTTVTCMHGAGRTLATELATESETRRTHIASQEEPHRVRVRVRV